MKQRMTVEIDKNLHLLFKSKCAIENVSMSGVIVQAIKDYLEDDIKDPETDNKRVFDDMTVTDTMSVDLQHQVEDKSWIKRKLNL